MIKELMKIRDRKASDTEAEQESGDEQIADDDGGENDIEAKEQPSVKAKTTPRPLKGSAELDKMLRELSMISDLPEVDHKELDKTVRSRLVKVQTQARSHRKWKAQFIKKKKALFERTKQLHDNRKGQINALEEEAKVIQSQVKEAELLRERDAELAAIQKDVAVKEAEMRLKLKYEEISHAASAPENNDVLNINSGTDHTPTTNIDDNSKLSSLHKADTADNEESPLSDTGNKDQQLPSNTANGDDLPDSIEQPVSKTENKGELDISNSDNRDELLNTGDKTDSQSGKASDDSGNETIKTKTA